MLHGFGVAESANFSQSLLPLVREHCNIPEKGYLQEFEQNNVAFVLRFNSNNATALFIYHLPALNNLNSNATSRCWINTWSTTNILDIW